MADAFRTGASDPSMPFEDHFDLLVDVEYSSRKTFRPTDSLYFFNKTSVTVDFI